MKVEYLLSVTFQLPFSGIELNQNLEREYLLQIYLNKMFFEMNIFILNNRRNNMFCIITLNNGRKLIVGIGWTDVSNLSFQYI